MYILGESFYAIYSTMGDFNSVPEVSLYDGLFQQNIGLQTTSASGITILRIAFVKTP